MELKIYEQIVSILKGIIKENKIIKKILVFNH